eukprot:8308030-Pyramimonas_sp.AAC.1
MVSVATVAERLTKGLTRATKVVSDLHGVRSVGRVDPAAADPLPAEIGGGPPQPPRGEVRGG